MFQLAALSVASRIAVAPGKGPKFALYDGPPPHEWDLLTGELAGKLQAVRSNLPAQAASRLMAGRQEEDARPTSSNETRLTTSGVSRDYGAGGYRCVCARTFRVRC